MYRITFTKQAVRDLRKMPRDTALLVRQKLELLAQDPFAKRNSATRLQGREGYRLRVGDWRVIYEIDQQEIVILVLKVAPRREVYK